MKYILICKSQYGISSPGEKLIPVSVILFSHVMVSAIQFDNQLQLMTTEIGDIPSDWVLFPKSQTINLATSQSRP
jgi:hypothetical protein